MKSFDWIVVGAGLTGSAVSYELAKKGFSVLLLEQHSIPQSATRYSYGGIPYWAATTPLTRQLYAEGIERQRSLSEELDADTQFRELDLILTISAENDLEKIASPYSHCVIPPTRLSIEEACQLEPLLNPHVIAGAVTVRHGHVNPEAMVQAYIQAFLRAGGEMQIGKVSQLIRENNRISGVTTFTGETYHGANIVVCAGGFSRTLLKAAGIATRLYFTHAELLETAPVDVQLRSLVMPAEMARLSMESKATSADVESFWDEKGHEPAPPIIEAGAIQFLNGRLLMGQISRVLTDPDATADSAESEAEIRAQVGKILPALENLPATWHSCLVTFSADKLPLVGAFPGIEGIHLFSGFSSPFVLVPPIAQRFANHVVGQADKIIPQLSPVRFADQLKV